MATSRSTASAAKTDDSGATQDNPMVAVENGMNAFAGVSGAYFGAVMKASQTMMNGVVEWNREMADFASHRLQADGETAQALMQCKDWSAVADIQKDFLDRAAAQYSEEATKLTNLATRVMQDSIAPLQDSLLNVGNGPRQPTA